MKTLLLLIVFACGPGPRPIGPTDVATRGPSVLVHYVYPEQWTQADRRYVEQVSGSWKALGLQWSFTDDPNRSPNHCPHDWPAKNLADCVIDVGLYKKDGMTEQGYAGWSNRETNESWIDSRWTGLYLLHVVSHEIGHQVLNTWEHLTVNGIMMSGGSEYVASPADHALACKTIKRACDK